MSFDHSEAGRRLQYYPAVEVLGEALNLNNQDFAENAGITVIA